jgi:hypothetical protein
MKNATTPVPPVPPVQPVAPPVKAIVPEVKPLPSVPAAPPVAPAAPPVKPIVPPALVKVPEAPRVNPVQTPATQPPVAPAPTVVLPQPAPLPQPAQPQPLPILPPPRKEPPPAAGSGSGKFVVLRGDKLVEGSVSVAGEKAVLRQGSFDRVLPKADVLFVGETKDEVYRFMLARVPATDAAARLGVARWCMFAGLREQALAEAREVLRIQPANASAAQMARSLEESLRLAPADGSAPVAAAKPPGGVLEAEPDVGLTAEGATTFASRAQPVLANQCMECHARDDHGSAFKLKRVTGFEVGPHSTHANLRSVAAQLKKDDPANSPLLVKALTAHGGMKQPAFVSRKAVAFQVLESWVAVAVASGSIPPMTPPTPPVSPMSPTSPVPPMTTGQSATTAPDLAPGQPESPATVPPVLPTPPSIPAAEPTARTTLSSTPSIPVIPPIDARTPQAAPLPLIPGVPRSRTLPKPQDSVKPVKAESQFGTGSKPPAPGGVDEFDPAAFNRAAPQATPPSR